MATQLSFMLSVATAAAALEWAQPPTIGARRTQHIGMSSCSNGIDTAGILGGRSIANALDEFQLNASDANSSTWALKLPPGAQQNRAGSSIASLDVFSDWGCSPNSYAFSYGGIDSSSPDGASAPVSTLSLIKSNASGVSMREVVQQPSSPSTARRNAALAYLRRCDAPAAGDANASDVPCLVGFGGWDADGALANSIVSMPLPAGDGNALDAGFGTASNPAPPWLQQLAAPFALADGFTRWRRRVPVRWTDVRWA